MIDPQPTFTAESLCWFGGRRASNAVDACTFCFSSKRRPRHLTIAIGQTAYLMLPPKCAALFGCTITVVVVTLSHASR